MYSGFNGSQRGFTIVEIMVAMLLGLILMAGVVSLMVGNKRSFNEQTEMSRLQENARFAMQFLSSSIRMAGYAGCPGDMAVVASHLDINDKNLLNMVIPIDGYDANSISGRWEASGSAEAVSDMVAGNDAVAVRFFTPPSHDLQSAMSLVSDNLVATSADGIAERQILAVSDCKSADIFQVTGLTGTATISHSTAATTSGGDVLVPGNGVADLARLYDVGAKLHHLYAARYYIRNNTQGIPALYRLIHADGVYTSQELVAGVENMQIMYGDGSSFVPANNVSDWEKVNSVKVGLLVRTEDEMGIDIDNRTYNVLDQAITAAGDRYRRKVFTTTIELRNRI